MDAIGFDAYNQCLTGRVAKTLNSRATDSDHLPCVVEVIGVDIYNLALTRDKACSLTRGGWTSTGTCPKVLILDHHSDDSRTDIVEPLTFDADSGKDGGGIVRTLTGDHNDRVTDMTALILEPVIPLQDDGTTSVNKRGPGWNEGGVCHTLNSDSRNYVVIPLEGNGARPSHHGDGYRKEGPMYSLNTTEVHSIAYAFEPGILKREGKENRVCEEISPTIREHMGDNQTAVAYTVDMGGGCDTYMKWDGKQGTAGKGALIQIEKSATLAASQDQYLFQPIDNSK